MTNESDYPCPCCGERTLKDEGHYDICENCDWEDDPIQRERPDYEGGANQESLNQARSNYVRLGRASCGGLEPRTGPNGN